MSSQLPIYKFGISSQDLDTIKATLPLVAEAGTDFTKHFYSRLFKAHPELLNLFNQTNQQVGSQPKKLLKTVAIAAQAAIDTGDLPGEAIEGICHKHSALLISPESYAIVGEHILGTIEDLLTSDAQVLAAWGALYGDIVSVFTAREKEIADEMAKTPGGWRGRRQFELVEKEPMSDIITRFKFVPTDGGPTPLFKPGKFTTVWVKVDAEGPSGHYTEQPRHYTLALPQGKENEDERSKSLSISTKKEGLVSTLLHEAPLGSTFDLSAPFGCFDLTGVEQMWLSDPTTPIVFISAGVGITPVLAMLEHIFVSRPASWLHASQNGNMHAYRDRLREIAAVRSGELQRRVWYSVPSEEDGAPGGNEAKNSSKYNLAKYHFAGRMDLPSSEKSDFDPNILHVNNPTTQYYVCGPAGFMKAQMEGLASLGVDKSRIHSEGFG